ncbi:radical SAM protein [Caldinitratiruptor microaerophilus]|uniref:Radical SAM protein n=1 Tax=Caldinitratiruptor microaerophilus TaxID=671077 RepID=A0AA35CM77_9FIRM|nr:radical SAM protein [Caldinitratiruptor microaerophilus]BDG60968.1 radical SAM protein [Caldinitratiruptor microaerophilus]
MTIPVGSGVSAAEVTVAIYPHSLSVSIGGRHVSAFDATGRVFYTFEGRRTYKWGLSGQVLEKGWERGPAGLQHVRADLDEEGKQALLARVREAAAAARRAVGAGEARLVRAGETRPETDLTAVAAAWLERAAAYSWADHQATAERFRQVYRPVTILPPDQYLAVVLQATEGCSWNRCTFCNFYRDRPFRVRTAAQFAAHLDAVRAFLGPSLGLRRTVFLADANALVTPQPLLLSHMEAAARVFPVPPAGLAGGALAAWRREHPVHFEGFYSFLDVFTGSITKGRREFEEMARRGLRRVYVGLETGSADLLAFLNKPGTPADAVELVREMKAAGLAVGVIVMAGAGGDRYAARHVAETVRVVRAMGLGPGDIIYLSPFVEHPALEYAARARAEGVRALTEEEVGAQLETLRAALRSDPGPRVSLYDIREFIY